MTAIRFHNLIDGIADLLYLIVKGDHSLLEELVTRHVLTNVEVCFQVSRSIGSLLVHDTSLLLSDLPSLPPPSPPPPL